MNLYVSRAQQEKANIVLSGVYSGGHLRLKEIEEVIHDLKSNLPGEDKEKKLAIEFLEKMDLLIKENDILYNSYYPENESIKEKINLMEVISGYYAYMVLGNSIFSLNHEQYGFSCYDECIKVVSAVVFNQHSRSTYSSDYYWETVHKDGSTKLNSFFRCIHGDFRFSQADVTPRTATNPCGGDTDLFKPEYTVLFAYHSVEVMFFATILRFSIETRKDVPLLRNYKKFIDDLKCDHRLGFFADAGMRRDFWMEPGLLDCPLNTIESKDKRNPHSIPKEHDGHISPVMDEGDLVYLPSGVRFTVDDIEPLIIGLHIACQQGFGRTTIFNLNDFFEHVSAKYFELLASNEENAGCIT